MSDKPIRWYCETCKQVYDDIVCGHRMRSINDGDLPKVIDDKVAAETARCVGIVSDVCFTLRNSDRTSVVNVVEILQRIISEIKGDL